MKLMKAIALIAALTAMTTSARPTLAAEGKGWMVERDRPGLELVLQLVVTCASPESMGGVAESKDGRRPHLWPIIGGRFAGRGISGVVVPGGADFPVIRPDGVSEYDALYRLRTDDGVVIIVHNRGIAYGVEGAAGTVYRTAPQFIAPAGKYDWLNKAVFVATLLPRVPPELALAKGGQENDRLIEVYRVK